ncbi:MAG: hypothetical protein C0418_03770 [Coriobacteriaceae bacterium]|nr:hypothetical protein [Coriobacteriaceae bacterium]
MIEQRFGAWGSTLSDEEIALSLLGLGLVSREARRSGRPATMTAALRQVLDEDPETLLHWSLDAPPDASGGGASRLAGDLAALVGQAMSPARRVAIAANGAPDGLEAWALFTRSEVGRTLRTAGWSFHVSRRVRGKTVRFRWPCRIGYFDGSAAKATALELASLDEWDGDVFRVSALSRRNPACDILLWEAPDPASAAWGISEASSRAGGASSDLCVLMTDGALGSDDCVRDLAPLFDATRSAGVLLVAGSAPHERPRELLSLLVGISHGLHLDTAIAGMGDGERLLVCDERLLRKAQLGNVLTRTANLLMAVPDEVRPTPGLRRAMAEMSGAFMRPVHIPIESIGAAAVGRMMRGELVAKMVDVSSESRSAARVGRVNRAVAKMDEQAEPEQRFLQAAVHAPDGRSGPYEGRLEPSSPCDVGVFVGALEAGFAHGQSPVKTPWADDSRSHMLRIVFVQAGSETGPQVRKVELKPRGPTKLCRFRAVAPETGDLAARITVLHRNRVLQTGMFRATVGTARTKQTFDVDAAPRTVLSGMDHRTKFDLAFVLNDNGGASTATSVHGDEAAVFDMDSDELSRLRVLLEKSLTLIASLPDLSSVRDKASVEMLIALAQRGSELHAAVMGAWLKKGALPSCTYVQVVSSRPGKVFPVELLYELECPLTSATLCLEAEAALLGEREMADDGWCRSCAHDRHDAADMEKTVCPLGFWGMRRVIERVAYVLKPEDLGGDFKIASEPKDAETSLMRPLQRAVVGVSSKARTASVDPLLAGIRGKVPSVADTRAWSDWRRAVGESPPATLLALVTHQGQNVQKQDCLYIGPTDRAHQLTPGEVKRYMVRPTDDIPHPLTLLLGCSTSHTALDYENFALKFQQQGSAAVVGTIASVLDEHVTPVALEIIDAISRTKKRRAFSEVMLGVRRRLLAQGTLMVLALVVLGDADWDVVAGN